MTGTMFGHYRLDALLGRGGMGEVWRALDTRKDRVVALKVLGPWLAGDADFARRFAREASLAARLRGPHVVPIHDYGAVDGRLFIDMELVDGVDLGALIEREGALGVGRTVDLVGQTAKALDTAHRAGMVHRDVKPSNILISDNGGDEFVHLIDFGIARAVDGTSVSLSGVLMGTPAYMAPERFDGHGDHRSDVYALGCVLHEMLTGRKPFAAEGIWAWGTAHHHAPPPRPSAVDPALPPGLDDVVARALAKDPDARFRSAGELAAATAGAATRVAARWAPAQGAPTFVPPPAPPRVPPPRVPGGDGFTPRATPLLPEAPPSSSRPGARRWAVPVAALAAAAAVVAGVVLVDGRGGTTGVAAGGPTAVPTTPVATATARPSQSAAPGVASSTVRVGDNPWTVALAPDGTRAFTADDGSGTVSVLDTARRAVTATVPVGGRPADVAVSPDGTRAYVADLGVYPAKGDTVRVIDTAAGTVVDTITVGSLPADVAVTPDGRQLYVADTDANTVSVVDTATHRVVGSVPTSSGPSAVAFSPDGRRAYVACDYAARVTVIDTAARSVVATVRVESSPQELAVSPDGSRVYVANKQEGGGVSVIDTGSDAVTGRIATGQGPNAVAFSPDGRRAYVSNFFDGTVAVIDTATSAVVATRSGFDSPDSVAVSPDGRTLYVAENGAGRIAIQPAEG